MTIHLGRKAACRLSASRLHIKRRIGLPPQSRGSTCGATCPDVFELRDGRFVVIGSERTAEIRKDYPGMRTLATSEIVVVVDRETLACAKAFIPDI
ncbi:hypothetical protein [Streptomyces sp. NRRL B-24085]|uniref:hypothetical protein n=1 Tax=Streptomyces sp. NRRL B-24085 TaxID=1709476 RepID=UPI000A3723B7|nr:hypothetical protein [Streptomyces sp. NRRL B-24085]